VVKDWELKKDWYFVFQKYKNSEKKQKRPRFFETEAFFIGKAGFTPMLHVQSC
jgi:hypothetical protein